MKKLKAILIGAGSRGTNALASYALRNPYELEFIAVAEPIQERREAFKKLHNLSDDKCFDSWEQLIEKEIIADIAIIATPDRYHFEPALAALKSGYNVLLEKPMAPDPKECAIISKAAQKYGKILSICHVLRYTEFFTKIKELLDNGAIGKLISISHTENVGNIHYSHSFVRGNWRNSIESSPMILAKSCHDTDILLWLAGSDCMKLSSFGDLTHFKRENAPEGAPKRCLEGCPSQYKCPYYAPKIYLAQDTGWPVSTISLDQSLEARTKAIQTGPYGRCVFYCDNDVVDHQVVNMEFANGVTAAFTMCAFSADISRTIRLMGTDGQIRGAFEKNEIEVTSFINGSTNVISNKAATVGGHGGGDDRLMRGFVNLIKNKSSQKNLTSGEISLKSHLMAFAAEESRLTGKVVNMAEYESKISDSTNSIK